MVINAAVFASGEGSNAENLFVHFANDPRIKFKIVVCNNEKAGVIKRAEQYRKTVQIISKAALENYTEQIIEFLKVEQVNLIILAGFLLKIPPAFIKAFPDQIINLHPSLLPKFGGKGMYGMNVHQAVIAAGETESGITVHYVNEEYDKGAIILQEKCTVLREDTAETLAKKIHTLEWKFLPLAVEQLIANKITLSL
ncbi:MAG: phosphoribosylglycinamide formyltransferase [Sediminibacterium sp.]|nr:phosphoribosylglycinamide formyltransferase [Sediminibacterium sp.]